MFPAGRKLVSIYMKGMLALLTGALLFSCVPPSVEELSGDPLPTVIHVNLEKITPAGEEVSLERKQNSFLIFDVRDAFDNIAEEGEILYFYWFVDWDTDNLVEPIMTGEDSLQYFACEDEYDPPRLNGDYPSQRTIMVLATNQPLEDTSSAYLTEEEGVVLAMIDWSIQFEGADQCTGEFE